MISAQDNIELDYEDIPFVFSQSAKHSDEPTESEIAVIAATLAALYPVQDQRLWSTASRLAAISRRLYS